MATMITMEVNTMAEKVGRTTTEWASLLGLGMLAAYYAGHSVMPHVLARFDALAEVLRNAAL